ncbi:MAG: THUMP domain-containing protein [Pseudomonadota bacterium]|nr:THUMP domain-containing protein [Pseudomonadota bacterium]
MPQFIAFTAEGLDGVLEKELLDLGIVVVRKITGGVVFEGAWEDCYRANLNLRTASRVALPVLEFEARSPEELYEGVKKHDFTQYIEVTGTVAVDASVQESVFHDQRFFALKIKDAIVDQFREKFNERPNVEKDTPDLRIMAKAIGNRMFLSIDTSGDPLFKRGYRKESTEAPLKETLAAGLIKLSGWDGVTNIIDPMCGSGTFLIEAALMATSVAPGTLRKRFAFQKFKNFDKNVWSHLVQAAMDLEKEEITAQFFGYDINSKAISIAKATAREAGVDHLIKFSRIDARMLTPPIDKGIIIVNPPFGERMGLSEQLKDVYRDLGHTLRTNFKGWECFLLSGNAELTQELKLKANEKHRVMNGPIQCRFLKYHIN